MQTVFEGFQRNSAKAGEADLKKFDLDIPYGYDPGSDGKRSNILKRYKTRGTPWFVLIDTDGIVQFSDFVIEEDKALELIDGLAKKAGLGGGLNGVVFPEFGDASWLADKGGSKPFTDSPLTLIRWWRSGSKPDKPGLAAVRKLFSKYKSKKLRLVVIVSDGETKKPSWAGSLLRDTDDRLLAALRDAGAEKDLASPTVVVDAEGQIRWFAPTDALAATGKSDDPGLKAYKDLEKYVRGALTKAKR